MERLATAAAISILLVGCSEPPKISEQEALQARALSALQQAWSSDLELHSTEFSRFNGRPTLCGMAGPPHEPSHTQFDLPTDLPYIFGDGLLLLGASASDNAVQRRYCGTIITRSVPVIS